MEKQQTDVKHHLAEFDSAITARFNDDVHVLVEGGKIQPQDWSEPVDGLDFLDEFHNVVSNPEVPEADQQFTPDVFDNQYLNMELALPHGDEATPQYAKVTKRLRDATNKNSSICCWIASLRRHYRVTGVVKVLKQKE